MYHCFCRSQHSEKRAYTCTLFVTFPDILNLSLSTHRLSRLPSVSDPSDFFTKQCPPFGCTENPHRPKVAYSASLRSADDDWMESDSTGPPVISA